MTHRKMPSKIPTIDELVPRSAEQLFSIAYASLSGDLLAPSLGTHSGNPYRVDVTGISKARTYRAVMDRDIAFFKQMMAQYIDGLEVKLPPGWRAMIPKGPDPSYGYRPIDDPSEFGRLVSLFARHVIEGVVEVSMTQGQYGGRADKWISKDAKACKRPGATFIDHMATKLHQMIHQGFPFVLCIDLANAFGELPLKAVEDALRSCWFGPKEIDYIWHLVRINALYAKVRPRKKVETRETVGIAQGNPLSAMIMNAALSPVFRQLESELGVMIYAYIDDIYVMAKTEDQARLAFRRFTEIAGKVGITNIRDLGIGGEKASKVIDVRQEPLILLKTNVITPDRIGLADIPSQEAPKGKLSHLIDDLFAYKKKNPQNGVTPSQVRRLSRSQALTKRWMRSQGLLPLKRGTVISPSDHHDHTKRLRREVGSSDGLTETVTMVGTPNGKSIMEAESRVSPDRQEAYKDSQHSKDRVVQMRDIKVNDATRNGTVTLPPREENPISAQVVHMDDVGMGYEEDTEDAWVIQVADVDSDDSTNETGESSLPAKRGMVIPIPDPVTMGSLNREGDISIQEISPFSISSPVSILNDPDIQEALVYGKKIRVGNRFEGKLIYLGGLEEILGDSVEEEAYRIAVNRLLKVGRKEKRVTVIIDPAEAWVGFNGLLGDDEDPLYCRVAEEEHDCGFLLTLEWCKLKKRPTREKTNPSPPPDGVEVVVGSPRRSRTQSRIWEVSVVKRGQIQQREVTVRSFDGNLGRPEAIGRVAEQFPVHRVAIPHTELLERLTDPEFETQPLANSGLSEASRRFHRFHRWCVQGDWIVGRPEGR